jgi:HlyD family secretion protein
MELSIHRTSKKYLRWLGFAVIGFFIPVILMVIHQNMTPQINSNQTTVKVTTQDLKVHYPAYGVVQAARKINLGPSSEGQIIRLFVNEGDDVEQGDLIAQMSDQKLQAQLNQAESALAKARAELAQRKAGSLPEEIAEAQARVDAAQASVMEAQATLNQAEVELERHHQLIAEGAISQRQVDEAIAKAQEAQASFHAAQSRLREQQESLNQVRNGTRVEEIVQAEASVAETEAQLQYQRLQLAETQVYAPFSGTIARLFVQEGDFVAPTTTTSSNDSATSASIAELVSGLEIEARIPEASVAQIQVGQGVEIRTDAYPDQVFQGQIRLIAPRAVRENNVTSFLIRVTPKSGQDKLRLGMNTRLSILGDSIPNALVLPLAAIVTQPTGETGVWVLAENHQPQFRPVQIGITVDDKIQILDGLSVDERILISALEDQDRDESY